MKKTTTRKGTSVVNVLMGGTLKKETQSVQGVEMDVKLVIEISVLNVFLKATY